MVRQTLALDPHVLKGVPLLSSKRHPKEPGRSWSLLHQEREHKLEEWPEVLGGTSPPLRHIGNIRRVRIRKNPPQKPPELLLARRFPPALENSAMYILQALAFFILAQVVLAQQPTPILPDPKLTPDDTFDVSAQDVCVPGYAKKVRAVPAWLKRQAYAE